MATSYLECAVILTHTTEGDQPLPDQPNHLNFDRKDALFNNREIHRTKSLYNSGNK